MKPCLSPSLRLRPSLRIPLFLLTLTTLLVAAGCGHKACPALFPQLTQTTYSVHPTTVTPKGVHLDASGLPINPLLIDRLVDEVESCLLAAYPDHAITAAMVAPNLTPPSDAGAACGRPHGFTLPIARGCLTVKVAADWHTSESEFAGSRQQLLHDVASETGDCGKGENGAGACYWRAGVQNDVVIVTAPSFYLFKDPLVRLVTGCAFPWSSPTLSRCMVPTTDAMSDGTGS